MLLMFMGSFSFDRVGLEWQVCTFHAVPGLRLTIDDRMTRTYARLFPLNMYLPIC